MGIYDYSQFRAPTGLEPTALPSIADVSRNRRNRQREDIDLQKEMMNFQSQLRLQELGKQMLMQKQNEPPKPPMNTVFLDRMTPYQEGQLALGRAKLDTTRDIAENKLDATRDIASGKLGVSQQNADTRARLAELHDMTDSEKMAALLSGKITLADVNNAAAMARTTATNTSAEKRNDATIAGARERTGMTIQGNKDVQGMRNEGSLATTRAAGEEARKTKGTPSADAGVTAHIPTQEIKARQLRANQLGLDHPEWRQWMVTDQDTGQVIVTPPGTRGGPSQSDYNIINSYLKNAPLTTPRAKEETTTGPGTVSPKESPVSGVKVPQMTAGFKPDVIKQYSPSRNQTRISEDGGQTWKILPGKQ